ncbi:class II D-tagatose-bisphosphate aldolase, non-catalytic subunit [Clostridium tertium]|jgi:D-tagatose-1,6-bisphosphate aldolase subunit GatZ/KbaZ|uniref:class II D-tagatose-bisphosphate aldolase, non-catalytic subunit n=2 Tax=Clostridiaceae TaxID=31979 RepID=UPI001159068F|nr:MULTISPECIES: class II D-tagatose-bisphosphate aldolase, non-catalytic subunit [Clostridium]MDB1921050.1 class II D-tagatose-bisphosphate aldolase, non-catalytic subunit [Clostridium tertium]MDB1925252.1 class II D-tagatose-bisphosphate aldolase, non-catalytic subunit [Clostridium tertium]MDB1930338.1 class II D-tagatose-bisphosphate aldolase, non-catalytic subunit [Clostridium tertium]MDB1933920.1 class II D-tagatose-bisphosphate aldolase, non-catalytic subunit [Clostridium tertium]MDB1936
MIHPMKDIVKRYKSGENVGIFSVCCSNQYVIEAAMQKLLNKNISLLVEATANQVDQFGGYTGMKPKEYVKYIYSIADKVGFPKERIILGGDHLGPLTWRTINPREAMENAKNLIREYVLAGFSKIHIDTSMPLNGDFENEIFDDSLIANRASVLCKVAEEAYLELKEKNDEAMHPVYIIGSEVPIPGGAQVEEEEAGPKVTSVKGFKNTVETFKKAFESFGVGDAWQYVIGVVVQPGVEFSSDYVWEYNREEAKDLIDELKNYPQLIFEAHSTDYQTPRALKEMVEDGFIILKVGPALTFGFREGIFALNHIENELLKYDENVELSNFIEVLDFSMIKNPKDWVHHYSGTGEKIKLERKYSLSDRARYYMPKDEVNFALEKLMNNLEGIEIPMTIISQFMHEQYKKVREGVLKPIAKELLKDRIGEYLDDYVYAVENGEEKILEIN